MTSMSPAALELSDRTRKVAGIQAKIVCAIVLGVLLLAGIGAVGGSFIPFALLQARVRNLSATGYAPFFTLGFYREMQLRLRMIGAANIVVALVLLLFRRQMLRLTEQVFADSRTLARDIRSAVSTFSAIDLTVLTGLVIFAALWRAPLLSQPMRYDEAYTYLQYSSHPFYAALSFYNAPNNHLLNTLLVRLAYLAFGNHPWALRLPVFLVGLCLVPASYIAARSLYRSSGAVLAAGLVASSSVLIEYSTNARGYDMVCLAFVALISLAAYVLRNWNSAAWLLFAVVATLGFYAVPIMLYPFGGLIVWLLLSAALGDAGPHSRNTIIAISVCVCVTMALTAELYSPVLAVSGPKLLIANKWVVASPFRVFLHGLPSSLASTWRDWNRSVPLWLSLVLVAGFFISLLAHRRCSRFRIPIVAALVAWVVPLLFAQRVVPFERVWLFALPLYFVTASVGVAIALEPLLKRAGLRSAMTLISLSISLVVGFRVASTHSASLANDCRGLDAVAAYLKTELKPGDSVVAGSPSDIPLYYYFQKEGIPASFINGPGPRRKLVVVNEAVGDTVQRVLEETKVTGDATRAWLLTKHDSASLYEIVPQVPPGASGH